ncbi:MAG: glycosyltransferase family 39 protein, partial [Bacteroidetes bacterium]|nr:glycosyltransferase family 39 protein [Bacteroidota bacterium]
MMHSAKDNFILFRVENMFYFYVLIILSSFLFFRITKKLYPTFVFLLMCLLYPSNINDICWTAGKVDLLCAIFLFLSLLMTFSFIQRRSSYKIHLISLFFSFALLTKETSVILPLITVLLIYLASGRDKILELKRILGMEIFILIVYFSYRVYIIGVQPSDVVTRFQQPGLFNSAAVIFKSFISLILPYDYLSIRNYLHNFNLVFTLNAVLILIFSVSVIFIFIRTGNFKYIILLLLIFLISITPNLIAGYFRPQLILIPFMFFTFSLLLIAARMNINIKYFYIITILILLGWGKVTFNLIQDWKMAYQKSVRSIKSVIATNMDITKRNIIIGLPSRYRQAFMLDYSMGAYNYWKYGEFKMNDKLDDLVLTGALDAGSLNSEISINKLSPNEFELRTTGKTQSFLRLDGGGNKYKDKD